MNLILKKSKYNLLLASIALASFTASSPGYAGFEWIPQKQKLPVTDNMVVQEAPVEPVAGESLDTPENIMMPAPNSGMMQQPMTSQTEAETGTDTDEKVIKTISFEEPESQEMQSQIMLPPPGAPATAQAEAITVQQLEESEKKVEIKNMETTEMGNGMASLNTEKPVSLVPAENPVLAATTQNEPVMTIKPFPIMNDQNKQAVMQPENVESIMPSVQETETSVANDSKKEVVMGFGKDMPLALALQQIIPSDYAYSFSSGVNPGLRVNWNGGKSWDIVLEETLSTLDLNAYYDDKKVIIHSAAQSEPSKTSSLLKDELEDIINVEPAAGTESVDTQGNLSDSVSKPLSTKRMNIQDPGETEMLDSAESETKIEMSVDTTSESVSVGLPEEESNTGGKNVWSARKGESLKDTLYIWSEKSNMQIIWEASYDYTLEKDFEFMGSPQKAFEYLLQSSTDIQTGISAKFLEDSQNPSRLSMIIVQDNEQTMKKQQEVSEEKAG